MAGMMMISATTRAIALPSATTLAIRSLAGERKKAIATSPTQAAQITARSARIGQERRMTSRPPFPSSATLPGISPVMGGDSIHRIPGMKMKTPSSNTAMKASQEPAQPN
jgi:hypothetical protein